MTNEFAHTPVLLAETIAALQPEPGGRYVDATLGGGGHAEKVLELSGPDGALLGIDADPAALVAASEVLAIFGDRVILVESYFDRLADIASEAEFVPVDGILFDLGVSSPQLDSAQRGFSFRQDAPLDMRFGPGVSRDAAALVNTLSEADLQFLFQEYGEERHARRVARRIVEERRGHAIRTTRQLADLVIGAKPAGRGQAIHPATRVFQALRIAVNDELGRLGRALPQTPKILSGGGRLAVITFHSLEDRIVKHFIRDASRDCVCPPSIPVCVCDHRATLRPLTPRPISATEQEVRFNPRARSAKLRVAERLAA